MRRKRADTSPPRASHGTKTLDARAREAIGLFVPLLRHYGCDPREIGQEVLRECRKISRSPAKDAKPVISEMAAAAEVLTLWFSEPEYLDSSGNPRPISLRGAVRSVEALVRQVDPGLDVEDVLAHLLRGTVLKRVGARFVPRDRVLYYHGTGASAHARSLQTLVFVLRTLAHNGRLRASDWGRFEAFAANARVPVRAIANFEQWARHHGSRLLIQADGRLHSAAQKTRRGEPTVQLGLGMYWIQGAALSSEGNRKRGRK